MNTEFHEQFFSTYCFYIGNSFKGVNKKKEPPRRGIEPRSPRDRRGYLPLY